MKTPVKSPFRRTPISTPHSSEKTSDRFIPLRCARNLTGQLNSASTPKQSCENATQAYTALIDSQLSTQKISKTLAFRCNFDDKENMQKENCNQLLGTYDILGEYITRQIDKTPYKILDAPMLQDDFYLNLVDWSNTDYLAVGLTNNVYIWNAKTSRVFKLCNLGSDTVTSISWNSTGEYLSVGSSKGEVQILDIEQNKKIRNFKSHAQRVGASSWLANEQLSTGSRDQTIQHHDLRNKEDFVMVFKGHKQEVSFLFQICGIKWSENMLASGGNDNKLLIWNLSNSSPMLKFNEHKAAVKAIAWSPHQSGILASGGGTSDTTIKFWNTKTNSLISNIRTGSQVCNLMWSKTRQELVSTHGYSQNQVILWKYPEMQKMCSLMGHLQRVLYLSMSPDGCNIVTGAGDETLRFWNIFPATTETKQKENSVLFPSAFDLR